MKAVLDKIIEICDEKIDEMSWTIQCHIMHERDGNKSDYSILFEILGIAYSVKKEMESFKDNIDNIVNHLTLFGLGEWVNPFLSDEYFMHDEEFTQMDVYEYLLWKYFSSDNLFLITDPSTYSKKFIEQHFAMKKAISDGFKEFFPDVALKKMTINENGENILSEWTEKDENNKMTRRDLEKISLISEYESFILATNSVKTSLTEKIEPFSILTFIRDN